jgi:aryl-alcohol dehydrogenase-like predicted oxidoreductase
MRYISLPGLRDRAAPLGADRPVSIIGLGTGTRVFTPEVYDTAARLLETFLAAGGNCVDTAHIYGFGQSEQTLGRWLRATGRRSEIVLITKGGHPAVDLKNLLGSPWTPRLNPDALRADLSESLERLQTDYIDLYLLHRDDETVPVGPLVEALNQEQARGRVRALGVSNWRVERVAEANAYAAQQGLNGFVISSPSLSLARPNKLLLPGTRFADEATRQWHTQRQFPLLAWSALAGGFMSGQFKPDDHRDENLRQVYYSDANFERLRRAQVLATRQNATLAQIGLAYVWKQTFPTIALVGPATVDHLNNALGALAVELSPEDMRFLDLTDP